MQRRTASRARPGAAGRILVTVVLVLAVASVATARAPEPDSCVEATAMRPHARGSAGLERARAETLWIFDADFEDPGHPDNQGWLSLDRSDTFARVNYWHKDTIRLTEVCLGESTWWCGKVDTTGCWRQPRGYGNDWICYLERDLPLSDWSAPGDLVEFEWDQRYAMEFRYDYGYVDLSTDAGTTWTTLRAFTNPSSFVGAGRPVDWDHPVLGHRAEDVSSYAGIDVRVRFRFESDVAYSSQDQYDNTLHSCKDGAWQLDNLTLKVDFLVVWVDDCESSGDYGWQHPDMPPSGQTGVSFARVFEPETFRGIECNPGTAWMMAAVDRFLGKMVNDQESWLLSPGINVTGADRAVAKLDLWIDLPPESNDRMLVAWYGGDDSLCVQEMAWLYPGTAWPDLGPVEIDGPAWVTWTYDLIFEPGDQWIGMGLCAYNDEPGAHGSHMAGVFLDRLRIGAIDDGRGTFWRYEPCDLFEDTFPTSGNFGSASVDVRDLDGLDSGAAYVVVSTDEGATWTYHDAILYTYDPWRFATLQKTLRDDMVDPGSKVLYYFEVADLLGNISTLPADPRDNPFEVSILPIEGSEADPGILLVDKAGEAIPGDDRGYSVTAEKRMREALDILGYEYDVYNVCDPGDPDWNGEGPTTASAYTSYDTHIWFTGGLSSNTLQDGDQSRLITWLSSTPPGHPRNLLLVGNEIAWELLEEGGEAGGFLTDWVGASYEGRHPGTCPHADSPDTLVRVRDVGLGFMTYDDRECWLQCACPELQCFDVVSPSATGGAVQALEYENGLGETYPAGIVKVDSLLGYRVVFLPFGIEFMNDGLLGSTGHYANGIADRVDLVRNIMEFFEKEPTATATTAPGGATFVTSLRCVRPNPFNPATTIEFSTAERSRVLIRVHNLAGRVVKTLLDAEVDAGEHGAIWDGTTDSGDRAASGVYFIRMEAAGYRGSEKLVLLK